MFQSSTPFRVRKSNAFQHTLLCLKLGFKCHVPIWNVDMNISWISFSFRNIRRIWPKNHDHLGFGSIFWQGFFQKINQSTEVLWNFHMIFIDVHGMFLDFHEIFKLFPSTFSRPPSGASAPSSKPPSRPSTRTSSRGGFLGTFFLIFVLVGWLCWLCWLVGWLVGRLVGYVGWLVVDFDLLVQNNSPAKFRIELHENVVFSLFPLDSSFECHEGNISIEHVWVIWIGYIIATVCSNYSSQLERLNQLNPTLWKSPACLDLHVWIPQRTFSPLRLGAYGNDLHLISCKHISTLIIHHNEAQE